MDSVGTTNVITICTANGISDASKRGASPTGGLEMFQSATDEGMSLFNKIKEGMNVNISTNVYSQRDITLNMTNYGDCDICILPVDLAIFAKYPGMKGAIFAPNKVEIISRIKPHSTTEMFEVSNIIVSYTLSMWIDIFLSLFSFWIIFVLVQKITKRPVRIMETLKEVLCHFINQESDACEEFMEKKLCLVLTMFAFWLMNDLMNRMNTDLSTVPDSNYGKSYEDLLAKGITPVFAKVMIEKKEFERSPPGSIKWLIANKSESTKLNQEGIKEYYPRFYDFKVAIVISNLVSDVMQTMICACFVPILSENKVGDQGWIMRVDDPLSDEVLEQLPLNLQFASKGIGLILIRRMRHFFEGHLYQEGKKRFNKIFKDITLQMTIRRKLSYDESRNYKICMSNDILFGASGAEVRAFSTDNYSQLWILMGFSYFICLIVLAIEVEIMKGHLRNFMKIMVLQLKRWWRKKPRNKWIKKVQFRRNRVGHEV